MKRIVKVDEREEKDLHSQKLASCIKCVDIPQQTCYQQDDIRMRSHGL